MKLFAIAAVILAASSAARADDPDYSEKKSHGGYHWHLLEVDEASIDYQKYKTPTDMPNGYPESYTFKDLPFNLPNYTVNFNLPQFYEVASLDLDLRLTVLQVFFVDGNLQVMEMHANFLNVNANAPIPIWRATVGLNVTSFLQVYYTHSSYPIFANTLNMIWPQEDSIGVKLYLYKRDSHPEKSLLQF